MTHHHPIAAKLLELAEPVATDAGLDLVDVQYRREQAGWVVRVFIDRIMNPALGAPPPAISFEDCERISRELGALFDVHDPVPQAYSLEVSSPGLDRPLRTPDHFRRFRGSVMKATLVEGVEGRRNFKGTIVDVDDAPAGAAVRVDVDGRTYALPLDDIDSARLVPDWEAVLGADIREAKAAAKPRRGRHDRPAPGRRSEPPTGDRER
jgi:ribosome maturation factor RimP